MAALARIGPGNDDDVQRADGHPPVAAGTEILLGGLIGLDAPDIDIAVFGVVLAGGHGDGQARKAQATSASATISPAATKA